MDLFWLFLSAFVADKLIFNTFYENYLGNYAFKQNDECLAAHQKELYGPLVGRSPPVEKHWSILFRFNRL